jgi:hypothetical protein
MTNVLLAVPELVEEVEDDTVDVVGIEDDREVDWLLEILVERDCEEEVIL